jgi:hypothetical protein
MENGMETADRPALPENEIEVTPEMIEAGVPYLYQFDPECDDEIATITTLFMSMYRVLKEGHTPLAR